MKIESRKQLYEEELKLYKKGEVSERIHRGVTRALTEAGRKGKPSRARVGEDIKEERERTPTRAVEKEVKRLRKKAIKKQLSYGLFYFGQHLNNLLRFELEVKV